MDTTTTKPNLFAAAKKKETPVKKDDKLEVLVKESEHQGFSTKLKRLAEIKKLMEEHEAEAKSLENDIKQEGQSRFLSLYQTQKTNPGSFILKGEHGGKFMMIVMDRYISIKDAERAAELRNWYGEDIVSENTTFSFNADLLEKHMEALSEAIMNCPSIPDGDKADLLIQEIKYAVAKGAINRLMQVPAESREGFFYNIQPVCQLKYKEDK
jgi:hypothetical protein